MRILLTVAAMATAALARKPFLQYGHDEETVLKFPGTGGDTNLQPVIGIVAQTLEPEMQTDPRFANYTYYVMSSFVKFLEGAGARIVPLVPSMSEAEAIARLEKINGVFLPGGDGDYEKFARFLYKKVLETNDNGTYLPIWGTCMGYE